MSKIASLQNPSIYFIGNSATDVTGSMYLVKFKNYNILLDCGLCQLNDIMTTYKANREMLSKIKPTHIQYIILSHSHVDHSGLIPALFAKGCHAHVYVPKGCKPYLKALWEDSLKIMDGDCVKLQRKHGLNANPFYNEDSINRALDRCIEVDYHTTYQMTEDLEFEYYPSGHLIHASQILLTIHVDDNIIKRVGFTGDIGSEVVHKFVEPREPLPFCDVLIGENTYNVATRPNKARDREKDIEKIIAVCRDSFRVLIPTFSMGRTQEILSLLYNLWKIGKLEQDISIYLDSPLSEKICNLYDEFNDWNEIWLWKNLHVIHSWQESLELQFNGNKCIILSASGFLNGGRVLAHLKSILPDKNNHVLFVGYAGENNLASQIKNGNKEIYIDGVFVSNKANITELRSFSSHASYEELIFYYLNECRYNKLCLVHGGYEPKVDFSAYLQSKLVSYGISSRVICVNQDQKVII